jgi:HTH-type transcriptional regulator/antitoxin HigA
LKGWFAEAKSASWLSPNDIKNHYASASILNSRRVVFNIGGNKYRLVTEIHYNRQTIYVRFIGTHAEYDKIGSGENLMSSFVTIKPIRNDEDLKSALEQIGPLLDSVEGTADYDLLEVLSVLVHDYEEEHHPIEPPDPIEAIKFRMEQQGLSNSDLESVLGSKSKVSEVMNRKRDLSIRMVRKVHEIFGISADTLIRPSKLPKTASLKARKAQSL